MQTFEGRITWNSQFPKYSNGLSQGVASSPCPRGQGGRWAATTSAREAPRLPSSTKRIAVQVAFDNFGHAIQDVNATTSTTSPPVSNPVAFNARGDELLGCFLLERIYSMTVRGRASRWSFVHDALK